MTAEDLLVSWRDTPTKAAIVDFVARVTGDGPDHVPPDARIATFDNDGTLWCEKPMPIQLAFILERLAEMATADESLRDQQPWKAAFERDIPWLGRRDDQALRRRRHRREGAAGWRRRLDRRADRRGVRRSADAFVASTTHPTNGRLFRDCAYLPMVELLRYLEANGFTTFIASGGDRDFMRPFADDLYGIPAERVIGSSNALRYDDDAGDPRLPRRTRRVRRRPGEAGAHLEPHRAPSDPRRRQLQRRRPDAALRRRPASRPSAC